MPYRKILIALIVFCSVKGFGKELTLKEALALSLEVNRNLEISVLEVKKMEERIGQAKSAQLPSLSLSSQYSRLSDVPSISIPKIGMEKQLGSPDNFEARASLKYLLFSWWKVSHLVQMNELGARAAELSRKQMEEMIVFSTTMAFYKVLLFKKVVETRAEAYQREKDHYRNVSVNYQQGKAARFDELKARIQLEDMNVQLIQAENDYKNSQNELKLILNMNLKEDLALKGQLDKMETGNINFIEAAMNHRLDLAILKVKNGMLAENLNIIDAENKPQVYLFSDIYYGYPYLMEKSFGLNWMAGIRIELNLFDGFLQRRKYDEAMHELRQNRIRIKDSEENIKFEIESLLLDIENTTKLVKARESNIELAAEALKIAQISYQSGVSTNLDVLDSDLKYISARLSHLETVFRLISQVMQLKRACGILTEKGAAHENH